MLTWPNLDRLAAEAGQFFLLRALTRTRWWKAHPISLSGRPDDHSLRFTVKALGDGTSALQSVRPGTRVMAEGPYGAFTEARATRRRIALIAGGIGITPLRAIYEHIDRAPGEVTLLYRARNQRHAIFHDELEAISKRRGFGYKLSFSRPARKAGPNPFSPEALLAALPDLPERDLFICGPARLIDAAERGARAAGVPRNQIHSERFAY